MTFESTRATWADKSVQPGGSKAGLVVSGWAWPCWLGPLCDLQRVARISKPQPLYLEQGHNLPTYLITS